MIFITDKTKTFHLGQGLKGTCVRRPMAQMRGFVLNQATFVFKFLEALLGFGFFLNDNCLKTLPVEPDKIIELLVAVKAAAAVVVFLIKLSIDLKAPAAFDAPKSFRLLSFLLVPSPIVSVVVVVVTVSVFSVLVVVVVAVISATGDLLCCILRCHIEGNLNRDLCQSNFPCNIINVSDSNQQY
uniref:Uncharacterized protein n=1 Tax=Glossina brevipalpis TaxID=37001 RepID=A0A1A9X1Y0_9MUSC